MPKDGLVKAGEVDQFNPYRAPKARLLQNKTAENRLHVLYLVPNYLFALLLLMATAVLLMSNPASLLQPRGLVTALIFYAPLLCFCLLRWGSRRHLGVWLGLQALLVLWLMSKLLRSWGMQAPDFVVGCVLVGINLFALLGALLQARALPSVKEQS
ncbi:MAG: hypothetical protein V4812_11455 [Pseudomonadota bacterium]